MKHRTVKYASPALITSMALIVSAISIHCLAAEQEEKEGKEAVVEKPSIATVIQGTLLDSTGQPINEGFVMLQGNPQLNALTCSDGRFRIVGEAWDMPDTLLASSAGKEVAQIKIDNPKVNELTIRLQPQDPEFTKIEMGMSLKIGWFLVYADYRIHPLTEVQKECIAVYDDFLKNKGNAIIEKMLAGTALADDEKRYEYILASQIWCRASAGTNGIAPSTEDTKREKEYYADVQKEFYRVSLKAIRRQRLTESDVHALRLMAAMYRGTGFDPTGAGYLQGMGLSFPGVTPGGPLSFDVPLLLTSPLLNSPAWSNYTSLSATTHLRLEGIWSYLDSYWKWQIQAQNKVVMSPPDDWKQHYWQDWYKVTSVNSLVQQANGRPVYLVCSNLADITHPGFYTRQVEYLRRALRGFADIYLVSQTGGTGYSDIWVDEWTYFGPNPQRDPLAGLDCPRWEDDDYTPLRHARTDKLVAMRLPWTSGEILLDLPRYSSFLDNEAGLHHNLILDRDGKVAIPFCTGDWSQITGRYFSEATTYSTYTRQGGESYIHALLYEQLLRALIANQGRMTPDLNDKILVQYPKTFTAKDDIFVVKSVDEQNSVIHAGWMDPGEGRKHGFYGGGNPRLTGEPKGDFLLKLNPETRYVEHAKAADSSWIQPGTDTAPTGMEYRLTDLKDLKPGDRFYATIRFPDPPQDVKLSTLIPRLGDLSAASPDERKTRPGPFDMGQFNGKELSVERIMNYLPLENYYGDHASFMPLYGRITRKENDVITVKINQDEIKEMLGYRFWKQEETVGRPASEEPELFWPTVKRWGDGTEEDRTYLFKVDGATDVYRNGLIGEAGDLAVGDYVFVEYEMWWETQKMQKGIILPERLQASAQMDEHN